MRLCWKISGGKRFRFSAIHRMRIGTSLQDQLRIGAGRKGIKLAARKHCMGFRLFINDGTWPGFACAAH